jgi:hypothetical protein
VGGFIINSRGLTDLIHSFYCISTNSTDNEDNNINEFDDKDNEDDDSEDDDNEDDDGLNDTYED